MIIAPGTSESLEEFIPLESGPSANKKETLVSLEITKKEAKRRKSATLGKFQQKVKLKLIKFGRNI